MDQLSIVMNNPGLCRVMWASASHSFPARQFISPHWHPISRTIKTINQVLIEYRGTYFNGWGKQLMASCLFEVIILGLFPSASWEEVASLVQMLFVRSQDGEAASQHATEETRSKVKQNNGFSKPVSSFAGNNAQFVALFHTHERQAALLQLCTVRIFVIFWLRAAFEVCQGKDEPLHTIKTLRSTLKGLCCGYNYLVPHCVFLSPVTGRVCL